LKKWVPACVAILFGAGCQSAGEGSSAIVAEFARELERPGSGRLLGIRGFEGESASVGAPVAPAVPTCLELEATPAGGVLRTPGIFSSGLTLVRTVQARVSSNCPVVPAASLVDHPSCQGELAGRALLERILNSYVRRLPAAHVAALAAFQRELLCQSESGVRNTEFLVERILSGALSLGATEKKKVIGAFFNPAFLVIDLLMHTGESRLVKFFNSNAAAVRSAMQGGWDATGFWVGDPGKGALVSLPAKARNPDGLEVPMWRRFLELAEDRTRILTGRCSLLALSESNFICTNGLDCSSFMSQPGTGEPREIPMNAEDAARRPGGSTIGESPLAGKTSRFGLLVKQGLEQLCQLHGGIAANGLLPAARSNGFFSCLLAERDQNDRTATCTQDTEGLSQDPSAYLMSVDGGGGFDLADLRCRLNPVADGEPGGAVAEGGAGGPPPAREPTAEEQAEARREFDEKMNVLGPALQSELEFDGNPVPVVAADVAAAEGRGGSTRVLITPSGAGLVELGRQAFPGQVVDVTDHGFTVPADQVPESWHANYGVPEGEGVIVVSSERLDKRSGTMRQATGDEMAETIAHEMVHATMDALADAKRWSGGFGEDSIRMRGVSRQRGVSYQDSILYKKRIHDSPNPVIDECSMAGQRLRRLTDCVGNLLDRAGLASLGRPDPGRVPGSINPLVANFHPDYAPVEGSSRGCESYLMSGHQAYRGKSGCDVSLCANPISCRCATSAGAVSSGAWGDASPADSSYCAGKGPVGDTPSEACASSDGAQPPPVGVYSGRCTDGLVWNGRACVYPDGSSPDRGPTGPKPGPPIAGICSMPPLPDGRLVATYAPTLPAAGIEMQLGFHEGLACTRFEFPLNLDPNVGRREKAMGSAP
jgi:hypothetical protein